MFRGGEVSQVFYTIHPGYAFIFSNPGVYKIKKTVQFHLLQGWQELSLRRSGSIVYKLVTGGLNTNLN